MENLDINFLTGFNEKYTPIENSIIRDTSLYKI
jgi:hypothetical protein